MIETATAGNIKRIMERRMLKQKAAAAAAGYSEQQFSDMLHGRKVIKDTDIVKIAKALDVTPNALFGIEGDPGE